MLVTRSKLELRFRQIDLFLIFRGTTTFFVMLSTRPEYNKKIAEAHLLAPSAFRKRKLELPTALFVKSLIKFWVKPSTVRHIELIYANFFLSFRKRRAKSIWT